MLKTGTGLIAFGTVLAIWAVVATNKFYDGSFKVAGWLFGVNLLCFPLGICVVIVGIVLLIAKRKY